jgi:hypothetical protein
MADENGNRGASLDDLKKLPPKEAVFKLGKRIAASKFNAKKATGDQLKKLNASVTEMEALRDEIRKEHKLPPYAEKVEKPAAAPKTKSNPAAAAKATAKHTGTAKPDPKPASTKRGGAKTKTVSASRGK